MQNSVTVQENGEEKDGSQLDKDFHPQAEILIQRYISDYSERIRQQAIILASQDDMVLSRHVKKAHDIIEYQEEDQNILKGWARSTGGVFLGIFGSGFIFELATGPTLWIGVYTFLGLIGVALLTVGHWRYGYQR